MSEAACVEGGTKDTTHVPDKAAAWVLVMAHVDTVCDHPAVHITPLHDERKRFEVTVSGMTEQPSVGS